MAHQMILVEKKERVGIIAFNRPEKVNAQHPTMRAEMRSQIEAWNADPAIGAIILTGTGRSFSAGADVSIWRRNLDELGVGERIERRSSDDDWTLFCQRSKPLICAINGWAMGAGLTITLPCDIRIASDQARLSMRFVRIGVIPEMASTHILTHIVGMGQALELMLSGKIVSGEEAARIGLVNRVVPHEKLMEEAIATAQEIAFNPTESLLSIKKLTWQNLDERDILTIEEHEQQEVAAAMARPYFREAITAFLEKRQPNFHKQ